MARILTLTLLGLLATNLGLARAAHALEVPFLSGRVVDQANLLDEATEQRVEETLRALEADTGAQVAVLTLPTLDGEGLEDFSHRVAETWALGGAEKDNGLLLLVVRDDRKVRFEVGYGLEATIPDLAAHRIIDSRLVPRFREGDFAGGIEAAVASVAGAVRGDPDALPAEVEDAHRGDSGGPPIFLFFLVLTPFMWPALVGRGCGGWFLYVFLMPFYWGLASIALGETGGLWVLGAWVVFGFLGRLFLPKVATTRGWGTGGSFGGGGFSGGGFSSGGFSGGGGSFGGGGASGSW